MDFKIIGVYNEKKETTFNGSFLHLKDGKKYEIAEIPLENAYCIKNNSVIANNIIFPLHQSFKKILLAENFLFI